MFLHSVLVVLALAGGFCLAGWGAALRASDHQTGMGFALLVAFAAGSVGWLLALIILFLVGVPWVPLVMVGVLTLLSLLGVWVAWPYRYRKRMVQDPPLGWGDGIATVALAVFCLATISGWNVTPDYVYHWGTKARRNVLAQGLDIGYLEQSWSRAGIHPDYPPLQPVLFTASNLLVGSFDSRVDALWAVVQLFFLLVALRELLRRGMRSDFRLQSAMAVLGLVTSFFGVGFLMAGGADVVIALTVAAGAALLVGSGAGREMQVGAVAALAAASKMEGVALGALLVLLHAARRARDEGLAAGAKAFLYAGSLPAAVVGVWGSLVLRYDLYLDSNVGSLDLASLSQVAKALWRSFETPNWHGFAFVLFALPVLLVFRTTRAPALLLVFQGLFYLYVFLAAPGDAVHWIDTAAPRLLFHLVPTALALTVIALDRWARGPA